MLKFLTSKKYNVPWVLSAAMIKSGPANREPVIKSVPADSGTVIKSGLAVSRSVTEWAC